MNLRSVQIHSYKSIVDAQIDLTDNFLCFIGLNESGKTNILNALRYIDSDLEPQIKDKSKNSEDLPYVKYLFEISENENNALKEALIEKIKHSQEILVSDEFINSLKIKNFEYIVQLEKDDKAFHKNIFYSINSQFTTKSDFFVVKANITPSSLKITRDSKEYNVILLKAIEKIFVPIEANDSFEPVPFNNIKSIFNILICEILDTYKPETIFWEYNSRFLLPSEILYADLIKDNNPYNNSAPLYNIFLITKPLNINIVDDLVNKIAEWKKDSSLRRHDSQIITDHINKYIQNIWTDNDQDLRIELEETKITIHIHDPKRADSNYYAMEARSQGFKTFVSFILTIAAEATYEKIFNHILILDEPETHLHPSGVRFMREELIKLSQNNFVFCATHSVFMIDRKQISRHIIVEKVDEKTILKPLTRSGITQESVIYEALGTSIDEFSLSNKNVLVEGEMDYILLSAFIENCLEATHSIFDYEILIGGGTNAIHKFFRDKIIPKDSTWIFILDNDTAGKNLKKDCEKINGNYSKNIIDYYYNNDNIKDNKNVELEDLLPHDMIKESLVNITTGMKIPIQEELLNELFNSKKDLLVNDILNIYKEKIQPPLEFDALFKEELIKLIKISLKEANFTKKDIDSNKTIFQEKFPVYFKSMGNIMSKIFPDKS